MGWSAGDLEAPESLRVQLPLQFHVPHTSAMLFIAPKGGESIQEGYEHFYDFTTLMMARRRVYRNRMLNV